MKVSQAIVVALQPFRKDIKNLMEVQNQDPPSRTSKRLVKDYVLLSWDQPRKERNTCDEGVSTKLVPSELLTNCIFACHVHCRQMMEIA